MALSRKPQEIIEDSKNPLLAKHESWERVPVGEIANILNGFAFKSSKFTNDKGVPLIRIRDVGKDSTVTYYEGEFEEIYLVEDGDLLVGMDGDFRCSIWKGGKALLNQRVCKISLKTNGYDFKFLSYVLQPYLDAIHVETSAVTVKHLSSRSIAEITLPLPPKEQQKRIVAKIEELFSHIDTGIEALKKAKQLLKQYRQSVLKAAVTGELTKEWRLSALAEGRARAHASELDALPKKGVGKYFVYIVQCDNDSYYVGYTDSLEDRWLAHCAGRGADWTKKHIPKYLIHWEKFDSQEDAISREKDLKTGFGRTW
jgi:predicted GIY-YIG superfamily endonuclease